MRLNLEFLLSKGKSRKNSDSIHNKFYFERIADAYTQSFALQTQRDESIPLQQGLSHVNFLKESVP